MQMKCALGIILVVINTLIYLYLLKHYIRFSSRLLCCIKLAIISMLLHINSGNSYMERTMILYSIKSSHVLWFLWLRHVTADQMTFQGCDINEARHLYDHLAVMCPIMVSTNGAQENHWVHLSLFSSAHCVAGLVSRLSHLSWVLV